MPLQIQHTNPDDVAILAQYWYDKMALLQHYNPHLRIAPDAQSQWHQNALTWLQTHPDLCLSSHDDDAVFGAVFGAIIPNHVGLLPARIGWLHALVIDAHAPQAQRGIARQLVQALKERLITYEIDQLHLQYWQGWAVETAFWQSLHAQPIHQNYRIMCP